MNNSSCHFKICDLDVSAPFSKVNYGPHACQKLSHCMRLITIIISGIVVTESILNSFLHLTFADFSTLDGNWVFLLKECKAFIELQFMVFSWLKVKQVRVQPDHVPYMWLRQACLSLKINGMARSGDKDWLRGVLAKGRPPSEGPPSQAKPALELSVRVGL